ncbi:MAG TPA: iron chelate uptake ABC transporter family permease subunit [Ignavibacteria bacterium]|nr:iron chelate uptake ABC transporter family permease subunit [Ignavibacteria bacterium]HMR39150.1 iron chelate uptake ABC transporter family permease subunit [Ignavibacteria bacterium]
MDILTKYITEPFQYEFIQRALIASIMVGVSCGLIGTYIMLRRLSLIGDALAHAVLPGVVIGFMIAGKGALSLFIGALTAGILTSILISFVERNSKIKEDTSIGIIFTGAFALGILLVSQLKQVHIDLSSYLFGDVLGVSDSDLILSSVITVVIIISVILFYRQLLVTSFDPTMAHIIGISTAVVHYFLMTLLSMSIVAGLQSVGVILIIAMLITPPATAFLITDKLKKLLILSCLFGVMSAVTGLYLSYHLNFASGASIVLVSVFFFGLAFLFSPKEGIIIKMIRRRKNANLNLTEDIIKLMSKDEHENDSVLIESISDKLGVSKNKIHSSLNRIKKMKLIIQANGKYELTEKGKKVAERLIRSHRLWETYVAEKHIVNIEDIHQDAEKFEHVLSDDLLAEIDEELGHPQKDPHGSPIPKKQ